MASTNRLVEMIVEVLDSILEHHDSRPVSMEIPTVWIDLLVQPYHIHSKRTKRLDVKGQCFVSWGSVLTVWPPALIEPARYKQRLAVQKQ